MYLKVDGDGNRPADRSQTGGDRQIPGMVLALVWITESIATFRTSFFTAAAFTQRTYCRTVASPGSSRSTAHRSDLAALVNRDSGATYFWS